MTAYCYRLFAGRAEVTPCAACARRHVVGVDPTLYTRRPSGIGTAADGYVIQALALDGWRMARLPERDPRTNALAGWICPVEDAAHAFVIMNNTDDLLRVVVEQAR